MVDAGLYIHIPFCISKCTYCDFFSIPLNQVPDSYCTKLIQEHEYRRSLTDAEWSSVYVGGGTPSLLSSSQIETLFSAIKPHCTPEAEITFECNPDDITSEFLEVLIKSGVTRVSLGIQSFSNEKLTFCKRRSTRDINLKALSLIQQAHFKHFSADLIAGLPPYNNDEKQLMEDIETLVSYGVDHISLYSLTIEEETPLYKIIQKNPEIINETVNDELWIMGRDFLEEKGLPQYEVSNFALKENQSVHNRKYWHMENYIGIGAGATGTIYQSKSAVRVTNTNNLEDYLSKPFSEQEETLIVRDEEYMHEYLMMGFRTLEGVNNRDFFDRFGISILDSIEPTFTHWQKNKKALLTPRGNYALTKEGLLLLNTFLIQIMK